MHGRSWRRAKAQGDEVMWYWLFYSANNYSRPHKIQTLFLFNISTANKEVLPSNKGHPFTLVYTWYPLSLGTWAHLARLALSHTWHWVTLGSESLGTESLGTLSTVHLVYLALDHIRHLVTVGTWSPLALGQFGTQSKDQMVPHTKSNVKVWIHEK